MSYGRSNPPESWKLLIPPCAPADFRVTVERCLEVRVLERHFVVPLFHRWWKISWSVLDVGQNHWGPSNQTGREAGRCHVVKLSS